MGMSRDSRAHLQVERVGRVLASLIAEVNSDEGESLEYIVGFAECARLLDVIDERQYQRVLEWSQDFWKQVD